MLSTNGPRYTNAKEHIYSITAGYISNASICIFILNGSHFARKRIYINQGRNETGEKGRRKRKYREREKRKYIKLVRRNTRINKRLCVVML